MVDLEKYSDNTLLTTSEVAAWLGFKSTKPVLCMPLPIANIRGRSRHYLAGEVKKHIMGAAQARPPLRLRKHG